MAWIVMSAAFVVCAILVQEMAMACHKRSSNLQNDIKFDEIK